jgi:hypothetical protein
VRLVRTVALVVVLGWAGTASAQSVFFSEDFESGFANWTMNGLWNPQLASEPCSEPLVPFPSGVACAWYGSGSDCSFWNSNTQNHYLTCLTPIVLPATNGSLELRFRTWSDTEEDGVWDLKEPEVSVDGGATWALVGRTFNSSSWTTEHYPLTHLAGQTIRLRFRFWAGDGFGNGGRGWFVDDVQVLESADVGIPQCLGDGTYRPCPCDNQGGPGRGCATSFNPLGAGLAASGVASVSADTLVFAADGMSNSAATLFQGSDYQLAPDQNFGGDGMTCMRTNLRRIATLPAVGGAVSYPAAGAPSISVRGGVPPEGGRRYYAVRYRNAIDFCTTNTFNVTHQVAITWGP